MQTNLRECVRHGTELFPFQTYATPNPLGPFSVPPHWHPEAEIILVTGGTLRVEMFENSYAAKAGEVLFVSPGCLHSIHGDGRAGAYRALVFPLAALGLGAYDVCQNQYLHPLAAGKLYFPAHLGEKDDGTGGARAACAALLQEVFGAFDGQAKGYQLRVRGGLFSLLAALAEGDLFQGEAAHADSQRQQLLRDISRYIGDHCQEDISLSGTAARFGFSPKYFCRFFKAHFGRTFTQYLTQVRLEKAAALLAQTDTPILAVAMGCGYDNFSYFIRRFKQQYGQPPKAWRQMVRAQGAVQNKAPL